MALTIVADVQAVAGKEEFLQAELLKLIEPTRQETGCIQYDLHVDSKNSGHFVFFERWETREVFEGHIASAHFTAFQEVTNGAVERLDVHEMNQIG